MAEALRILYVTSELDPLVSTGGLADVSNALPRALRAQGHDVRVALPCYDTIPPEFRGEERCMCVAALGSNTLHGALRVATVPETDIPLYLIEHNEFFSRGAPYGFGAYEFEDNAERFCFFSLAVLDGVAQTGWRPDIIHCNDWHTAAIPAYVKTRPLRDPAWQGLPTLLTIHNLSYQGRYPSAHLAGTGLNPELFTEDYLEFYGDINLMKVGIAFASKLNTVSPSYAKEIQTPEFGAGMDGFLRTRQKDLTGILAGVDYSVWTPAADPFLTTHYSAEDMSGKASCKAVLQGLFGLPEREEVPVFSMITRISWQKGIDILIEAAERMLAENLQVIILGTGDPFYEQALRDAMRRYPGKMAAMIRFDIPLSHLVEAGSDFFLMPSRYEPCGLSQMYSLAYGTIPVVHETGGLADSVRQVSKATLEDGSATGILFSPCDAETLTQAVRRAVKLYQDPATLQAVRLNGMRMDFSWGRAAAEYVALYRKAIAQP